MPGKGPAPTPTAALKMRGSWRANLRPMEPQVVSQRPNKPAWLRGLAKDAWEYLARQLEDAKIITKLDKITLARYCKVYAKWREAEDVLDRCGSTYEYDQLNPKGESCGIIIKERPQVKQAIQYADQMLRMEQQLGLTPSARARLITETPKLKEDKPDLGSYKLG